MSAACFPNSFSRRLPPLTSSSQNRPGGGVRATKSTSSAPRSSNSNTRSSPTVCTYSARRPAPRSAPGRCRQSPRARSVFAMPAQRCARSSRPSPRRRPLQRCPLRRRRRPAKRSTNWRALTSYSARTTKTPALIRALDGRFIAPVIGGDLIRTPAILPTGRNLHGFDPYRIPSAFAITEGARQSDCVLARYAADGHPFPGSVAIVLWGTDNLKTEGVPIGQALALIGAEPRFDTYGRLSGASLVPLQKLGRPRIDVMLTVSGIFRDLLPAASPAAGGRLLPRRDGGRAGGKQLSAQTRAGASGGVGLRHRDGRAARVQQRRRRLWRECRDAH